MAKKASKSAAKKPVAEKASRRKPGVCNPNRASPLQRHFEKAGVRFDLAKHEVLARLKEVLGRKRHQVWRDASIARQEGWGPPEAEYETLRSAEEVNTVFSLQSQVTLTVCEWLAGQVTRSGLDHGCIGELGCGSGILAGWLASECPDCQVIGWDAMPNLIEAASSSQKRGNLSFETWDYVRTTCPQRHACSALVTCFGVDFPIAREPAHCSLDAQSLRTLGHYKKMHELMRHYFRGWRTAIRDNGSLYAVLRIPSEVLFIAAVDAAHDEGWHLDLDSYESLSCGDESFPAMTFRAVSAQPHSEEVIRSLWSRRAFRESFAKEIQDSAATCVYGSLASKTILKKESRTYDDDHTMEAVVGRAGFLGFQYTQATTGFARLKLMSLDEADRADPWFPAPPPFEFLF